VSNAVWDKPGPLTLAEMERVRLHPYLTERMLAGSPVLARPGSIAVQHHERLDGSGYPRGLRAGSIGFEGRVLAVADRYATLIEDRPHRPARGRADAALALRDDVRSGLFDAASVDAVLGVAGHPVSRRRRYPAGLTTREIEVLRLLTLGLSVKAIAKRLSISPKTVSSHAEHIYAKTGATNRATLALFAAHHGLLADANIGSLPDEPETSPGLPSRS
jgi:DNA-binding CsgD family transcriptional regulator